MRFSTTIALALPVAVAYAETFTVIVAQAGGLTFTPPSINAVVGDTVNFVFTAGNHTVTRSTFDSPCTTLTGVDAIDSGFRPVASDATQFESWGFTLTDVSTPFWMFCNRAPHCARGMVFAINPTPERTFNAFQLAANNTAEEADTAEPSGGATPAASGVGAPAPSDSAAPASGAVKTGAASVLVLAAVGLVSSMVL